MSQFDDLSRWDDGVENEKFRAVGWLEAGLTFQHGDVGEEFFEALMKLLVNPWQPYAHPGFHRCPICRFAGPPPIIKFKDYSVEMGALNLFVPGDGVLYVAPSLIVHFIDAHDYRPPDEFIEAVMKCPDMKSMAYLKKLKSVGGMDLMKRP
jgi:hypothetical protein